MSMVGNDIDDTGAAAEAVLGSTGGTWQPECWSKSPEQMQEEAKTMNQAGFAHAAANAHKHCNPPAPPSSERLL